MRNISYLPRKKSHRLGIDCGNLREFQPGMLIAILTNAIDHFFGNGGGLMKATNTWFKRMALGMGGVAMAAVLLAESAPAGRIAPCGTRKGALPHRSDDC